jgi:hypothetical protein
MHASDNGGSMTENVKYSAERLGEQRSYHGGLPRRLLLLGLISLLVLTFEVFLLLTIGRVRSLRLPMAAYLLPVFHLLPWLAGLSCWARVRRSGTKGEISPSAADLCYRVIIALLSATYVVLGLFELSLALP